MAAHGGGQAHGMAAALSSGAPPMTGAVGVLSPTSRRKREAARRRARLERLIVEEDRRRFLRWYNPEKFEAAMQKLTQRRDMKSWFDFLDADGSGEIDQAELEDPLTSLGLAFSRRDVADLIASVDEDGTGEIGFEEFFEVVSRKTARGRENPLQRLYAQLASGALGDRNLHLSVLLAAYRRHLIMSGLATYGPGGRKRPTCRKHLRTVHALQQIHDEGPLRQLDAMSAGSSARPPSTVISLTASAHSDAIDDPSEYIAPEPLHPSVATAGPGVSYRSSVHTASSRKLRTERFTDAELATFEARLLRRHLPTPEAAEAALKNPGKRQFPDLRDYDAFKVRGSNKSATAIVASALPRFTYASVGARLAREERVAAERAKLMASTKAKRGTRRTQSTLQRSRSSGPVGRRQQQQQQQQRPSSAGRAIEVPTYGRSAKRPHVTAIQVTAPDPASLPPPPLKPKLRSSDPRTMTAKARQQQVTHMNYIGLRPQYARTVAKRGKRVPVHVRAGFGLGHGLWGYNNRHTKPTSKAGKSIIAPKPRPELSRSQSVMTARSRSINRHNAR